MYVDNKWLRLLSVGSSSFTYSLPTRTLTHSHSRDVAEMKKNDDGDIWLLFCRRLRLRERKTCALSTMSEPEKWLLTPRTHTEWSQAANYELMFASYQYSSVFGVCVGAGWLLNLSEKFEYQILRRRNRTHILYWINNGRRWRRRVNINWNISAKFSGAASGFFATYSVMRTATAHMMKCELNCNQLLSLSLIAQWRRRRWTVNAFDTPSAHIDEKCVRSASRCVHASNVFALRPGWQLGSGAGRHRARNILFIYVKMEWAMASCALFDPGSRGVVCINYMHINCTCTRHFDFHITCHPKPPSHHRQQHVLHLISCGTQPSVSISFHWWRPATQSKGSTQTISKFRKSNASRI